MQFVKLWRITERIEMDLRNLILDLRMRFFCAVLLPLKNREKDGKKALKMVKYKGGKMT